LEIVLVVVLVVPLERGGAYIVVSGGGWFSFGADIGFDKDGDVDRDAVVGEETAVLVGIVISELEEDSVGGGGIWVDEECITVGEGDLSVDEGGFCVVKIVAELEVDDGVPEEVGILGARVISNNVVVVDVSAIASGLPSPR
jgi:hypothetical protein